MQRPWFGQFKPPLGSHINLAHSLSRGLVGVWPFSEGSGLLLQDASSHRYAGTLTNGPAWNVSQRGPALTFDGSDDYVAVPMHDDLSFDQATEPWTILAWVNVAPFATGTVVSRALVASREYQVYINGGKVVVNAGGTTRTGATAMDDSQWHQVGAVWRRPAAGGTSVVAPILDGKTDLAFATSGTAQAECDVLFGARRNNNNTDYSYMLNGRIALAYIWRRGLTDADLADLYANPFGVFSRPWWFVSGAPPAGRPALFEATLWPGLGPLLKEATL